MIQSERISRLNDAESTSGRFVLYWMQVSQRCRCNHALEYAIERAEDLQLPLLACFGLMDDYPEANERHYAFMLEGLAETARNLHDRGVKLVIRRGHPVDVATRLAKNAAEVVCDAGYLRHQRKWRRQLARRIDCPVTQVEADVVVPALLASNKEDYAARTFRPKHREHWNEFLVELEPRRLSRDSLSTDLGGEDVSDPGALLRKLNVDRSVGRVAACTGGTSCALQKLDTFLSDKLSHYADRRNDPSLDIQSHLSAYLHFGQISPLEIALAVKSAPGHRRENKNAFLEELLVRRELSINFVLHNTDYDRYGSLPSWARATLHKHRNDEREHVYRRKDLEAADTHDEYWNAAMTEMLLTGSMHNYMRMYWGKKIIQWTRVPETAFRWMLTMNNRYFLDGRDPNSFAGVAWCFGKHDRPWTQRDVFGTVRYMSAGGLERKFDIDAYVEQISRLR